MISYQGMSSWKSWKNQGMSMVNCSRHHEFTTPPVKCTILFFSEPSRGKLKHPKKFTLREKLKILAPNPPHQKPIQKSESPISRELNTHEYSTDTTRGYITARRRTEKETEARKPPAGPGGHGHWRRRRRKGTDSLFIRRDGWLPGPG